MKQAKQPKSLGFRIGITLVSIIGVLVLAIIGYFVYLEASYYRIDDHEAITLESGEGFKSQALEKNTNYTASIYNIGFGAYTPDFTFFMDTGVMEDGTEMRGEHGKAVSKESVEACTNGDIALMKQVLTDAGVTSSLPTPDFMLFQEVDFGSDRSYFVNQREALESAFPHYAGYFTANFHSPYLLYPPQEPHGLVRSGLLSLSAFQASGVDRRSYPIDMSWPTKYTDLDRCFMVMRYPVQGGKELVLVNNHMSAYDEGGIIRAQQFDLLKDFMAEEAGQGNYVIIGGDWNHALGNSVALYPSKQQIPDWVSVLKSSELPTGFSEVVPENLSDVASCRGCDIPYEKGVTYTVTVDGFVVSDNVEAKARIIDAGFTHSDHNPVVLDFKLN